MTDFNKRDYRKRKLFKAEHLTPYFIRSKMRQNTKLPVSFTYWKAVFEATAWPIENQIGGMPQAGTVRFLYNRGMTVTDAIRHLKECYRNGSKPTI